MAKGKASSNSKARVKAPPKKAALSKNTKTLAPQHNSKGKGTRKRAANDDVSSGESSGEELDPRPQKKHCRQKETSDEDEDSDNDEMIQVDSEV